ncbi:MAG: hypothetical protein M1401_14990 [Chloroflexi bacterium]|jgi:hypothetical protein|nr:hypothetical protein [Chloroflexota bacterium]
MKDSERVIDRLLIEAKQLTPREAVVFLLDFDRCFKAMTGKEASETERLIVSCLLRRVARQGA